MAALIADRDPLARNYTASLLKQCGLSRSEHVASFGEVLHRLSSPGAVDLVIVDFDLPAMGAEIGIKHLRSLLDGRILAVLTTMDQRNANACMKRIDADAVISKQLPDDQLIRALQKLVMAVDVKSPERPVDMPLRVTELQSDLFGHELTVRQRAVLDQVVMGRTNRQTAEALGISEGTVKAHLIAAFRILGVHNRVSAVAAYSQSGSEADDEPVEYLM